MTLPTTRLTDDALRRRMEAIAWFHSIALRPGLVTAGAKSEAVLAEEEAALLGAIDLRGRSVLDVGAWNGYFSFAAKRRGAARVLATDDFAWRHPAHKGQESFELARAELGLDVEMLAIDPARMTKALGRFDVVLFLGVFCHLFDPLDVLERMRDLTAQLLLIETHQDLLARPEPRMVFYPGATLNQDATNWWGPNPRLMRRLLHDLGFARIWYRDHPFYVAPSPGQTSSRGIFAALAPTAHPAILTPVKGPWRELSGPGAFEDFA